MTDDTYPICWGKNQINNQYGFYFKSECIPETIIELTEEEHFSLVDKANADGDKIIVHNEELNKPEIIKDPEFEARELEIKAQQVKQELQDEDYKIIKSMEAFLTAQTGISLPYDIKELNSKRDNIRSQVKELESKLAAEKSKLSKL